MVKLLANSKTKGDTAAQKKEPEIEVTSLGGGMVQLRIRDDADTAFGGYPHVASGNCAKKIRLII